MKYLKLVVSWLVLSSCIESEMVTAPDVEQIFPKVEIPNEEVVANHPDITKSQSGVIAFKGTPFSGYLLKKYTNDSVFQRQGYLNGVLNGVTTGYYPSGQILYSRPYLDGEKHGEHIGYHQNGVREFQYYFVNGFSEGNHKKWYPDGSMLSDMNYRDGKEFGKQQVWRPDGKLRANYVVRENGRRYGLQGIKRCTKLDGVSKTVDPYKGAEQ